MSQENNNFIAQAVKEVLGSEKEFQKLLQFADTHPNQPESVRINSLRVNVEKYIEEAETKGVSFSKVQGSIADAYYVSMEGSVRKWWNQERLMGKFYSQGNASMIPPIYLLDNIQNVEDLKVLDMCAAPGSKTTQLGALMRNKGLLVANDYKSHRLYALHRNLQVFGIANAVVTQLDGRWISSRWPKTFDRTLLDAPCSGTGSSRNKLFSHRTEKAISHFQKKQKGLLTAAINSVKDTEDAYLIYSTCSLLPHENELLLQPFIEKNVIEVEELDTSLLSGWQLETGIHQWLDQELSTQLKNAIRVNPHWNDSDAFFIAKLRVIGG